MGTLDNPPAEATTGPSVDVVVVSTYTTDWIPRGRPGEVEPVSGGPAHYIAQALDVVNRSYRVYTHERPDVTVLIDDNGEQYLIPRLPTIPLPAHIEARCIILSPIMREIDPYHLPDLRGQVVVDLQGFVRTPSVPSGQASEQVDLSKLFQCATIVKATEAELALLTAQCRRMLGDITLVLTRGDKGSTVIHEGHSVNISARPVRAVRTIGAGDTFLAGFCNALLDGNDPVRAAEIAAQFTERFLMGTVK